MFRRTKAVRTKQYDEVRSWKNLLLAFIFFKNITLKETRMNWERLKYWKVKNIPQTITQKNHQNPRNNTKIIMFNFVVNKALKVFTFRFAPESARNENSGRSTTKPFSVFVTLLIPISRFLPNTKAFVI